MEVNRNTRNVKKQRKLVSQGGYKLNEFKGKKAQWGLMKELWKADPYVAQSCPTLCDPWTVAHQAPPSMEFSRPEYWNR